VRCSKCGRDNPEGAQFCALCGANLREQRGEPRHRPQPADRRGLTVRELEQKAQRRRLAERLTSAVLAIVAAGLVFAIVRSFRTTQAAHPLVSDRDFVGAATIYLDANKKGDWKTMWECLAAPVKRRVPYNVFRQHVGRGYLRRISYYRMVDFSYFDPQETKAYMAVDTSLGPQALFFVKEGAHWKIAWCFPVRDIAKLDIPF